MNAVNLIGRIAKDIEVRHTDSGLAVTKFSIAVDRPPKADGTKGTDWPNIVAFGKTAENIGKFFSKGKRIGITGHLQTGSYEKADGTTVYTTDVMVDKFDFIEPYEHKSKEEEPQAKAEPTQDSFFEEVKDDDIPF